MVNMIRGYSPSSQQDVAGPILWQGGRSAAPDAGQLGLAKSGGDGQGRLVSAAGQVPVKRRKESGGLVCDGPQGGDDLLGAGGEPGAG